MTREEVERVIKNVEPYYPWKHEINYLRDHDQAQREEIARLREALDGIMTGGNHLALQINDLFGEHPPVDASCEDAMGFYRVGVRGCDGHAWKYDVWVCWKKIMQARAALAGKEEHELH